MIGSGGAAYRKLQCGRRKEKAPPVKAGLCRKIRFLSG
jgi:hypothetical protein